MVTRAALASIFVAFIACGSKSPTAPPSPEPAKAADPAPAEPTKATPAPETKAAEPTVAPATTPPATTAPADPTPVPTDPAVDPTPSDETAPPPPETPYIPPADAIQPAHPLTVKAGDEIRDGVDQESPEGLIQRVLVTAMEPDEPKAWAAFEALLHEDQKYANALTYRHQFNFPAMRRKYKLFLLEPGKPWFKIDRILQDSPYVIRLFVHNSASMPTPCEVRLDQTTRLWKIGICSL